MTFEEARQRWPGKTVPEIHDMLAAIQEVTYRWTDLNLMEQAIFMELCATTKTSYVVH